MNPTGEFGVKFGPIRVHALLAPREEMEGAYAALMAILDPEPRVAAFLLDKETER